VQCGAMALDVQKDIKIMYCNINGIWPLFLNSKVKLCGTSPLTWVRHAWHDRRSNHVIYHVVKTGTSHSCLSGSQDQMNTAFRFHDIAHLTRLESERGVFEGLLHLTPAEPSEIAVGAMGRAV